MTVDRRSLLKGAAVASGAALVGARSTGRASAKPFLNIGPIGTPSFTAIEGRSPVEHVVVVMMENRSFDHFMGWMPGANGIGIDPEGKVVDHERYESFRYKDRTGKTHGIYQTDVLNACADDDPDHGYTGGRLQWNHGKMDGFVQDPANTVYALSYYDSTARVFSSPLAMNYTTCDNYFCSFLGATWPNRVFQHAAQTDRSSNDFHPGGSKLPVAAASIPTIWDQLNQPGGPSGRYYFNDLPFLGLWGLKHIAQAAPYAEFLVDAALGTLPNYSVVEPRFEDEGTGISGDDHPLADLRAGDAFLSEVFHALANGPKWSKTLLIINYDEWGGFFDHVAPPLVTPGNQRMDTQNVVRNKAGHITKVLAGFRVPCILASPWTRGHPDRPRINSYAYDHTSVLRFVEWNWKLHAMTPRDASIPFTGASTKHLTNLRYALDFAHPRTNVPDLPEAAKFLSTGCPIPVLPPGGINVGPGATPSKPDDRPWKALKESGLLTGWI